MVFTMKKNNISCFFTVALVLVCLTTVAFAGSTSDSANTTYEPTISVEEIPVYDVGTYDLGNGVTLIIEDIPEEEQFPGDKARLNEENEKMPLEADTWTYFCEDEPWLNTNLKIYNYAGPGNLFAYTVTTTMVLPTYRYSVGIAPGKMARLEGIGMSPYAVYLQGDETGKYHVRVSDWPGNL